MNSRLYQYHGPVSQMTAFGKTAKEVILADISDQDKAPVRLNVYGGLAKYIYEIEMTDAEERYIDADFYFDRNLALVRIEIPSTEDRAPAKVITQREHWDTEPIIFGPREYIDEHNPEPMDKEQLSAWLEWKYRR